MPGRQLSPLLLAVVVLALALSARADNIEIQGGKNSKLEIRNITLPDGSETKLYVLRGDNVKVTIGEDTIVADYIEFDFENDLVRIVGPFKFVSDTETITGRDFVLDLSEETFQGKDVLIVSTAIDVSGAEALRSPGQIDVLQGSFSPCSRCGQQVEDYGFAAHRLVLYPGDRLVAFDVTVLIRNAAVFYLPLMVIPLGPQDRQPQLSITSGTATERAEIQLDWPYVVGANAFGFTSLHYYADVVPGQGNFITENLLGGAIATSYFGGGFDHTFYTDRGTGEFEVFYTPSFLGIEPGSRTPDEFRVRFSYETDELVEPPSLRLLIERDDARQPRIVEYDFASTNIASGIQGTYMSQGYVDLLPGDAVETPSYASRRTPEYTFSRLLFEPEAPSFSVGPFLLSRLALDLGLFQDVANPLNRSAAVLGRLSAGRLLESHHLELRPLQPWAGLSISGETDFQGQYYTTAERLIKWDSDLRLRQNFGSAGNLDLAFHRDINEGETPFRFDTIPLRSRTDLTTSLSLTPLSWLSYKASETYVFLDNRNPQDEGFGPLENTLTLFGDLDWLDLTFEEAYDLKEGDPGLLESKLVLKAPSSDFRASLTVQHTEDLEVTADRVTGLSTDESETDYQIEFGYRPYLVFDMSGGFDRMPDEAEDGVLEYDKPLEIGLTVGTTEQNDSTPGFRVGFIRDLNRHTPRGLDLAFSARLGRFLLDLQQDFDFVQQDLDQANYRLTWEGVMAFEASGFPLLPPAWVGLELGDGVQRREYTLHDEPDDFIEDEVWSVSYLTDFDPKLDGGKGGFENSHIDAAVELEQASIGAVDFGVAFSAVMPIKDDVQPRSYLRDANLRLGVDIAGTVGLQGGLSYRAVYDPTQDSFSRQTLGLDDFGVSVKLFDQLYLSALLNDVWDFSGNDPSQSPWNFQPTLYVVWDRCCWALYGSWDTMTGQVRLAVTTPGADQGLTETFDSGLRLPGRKEDEGEQP